MTDLLARWREAERTIGDPAAVGAVDLPPRLAALLAALEALDAGDEAALRALAAPPDVRALLDLLLAPPGAPRPDWSHVEETFELPFRDVLALLDVARTGAPGEPGARLDVASRYRPVLHALVRLCTDARTDVFSNPVLAAFSRRVDQLQMVARAAQVTGSVARTRLGLRLDALPLDPARWPEITAERVQGDLRFWASTRIPWDEWHDAATQRLLQAGDEGERREALGLALDRVGRDLRAGRVVGSARPIRAAFSLAWSLDPASPLVTQLALLQLRADRYDPEHPGTSPLLLLHLWRHRDHLRLDEQVAAARALLLDGLAPPDDARAAALRVMAHDPDPDRAVEVLVQHALRWAPDPLLRGLAAEDAPIARRVQLAGVHAAAHRAWAPAAAAIQRLAREAPACVPSMLRVLAAAGGPPDPLPMWDALGDQPLGAWGPVLAHPALAATVDAARRARLRALPVATAADRAAAVVLAETAEEARAAVLDLGRHLRATPDGDAVALEVIGWWHTWSPEGGRAIVEGPGRPVAAMLLRQGGGAIRRALVPRLAPWSPGAVAWWLAQGDPGLDAPGWRDALADLLVAPEGAHEALRAAAHRVDLAAHRTLDEAARAIHAAAGG